MVRLPIAKGLFGPTLPLVFNPGYSTTEQENRLRSVAFHSLGTLTTKINIGPIGHPLQKI
jgi:hypothetical protein